MPHSVQKEAMQEFKGTLNQAIASLNVARSAYSSMILTPAAIQVPTGSGDKGYQKLVEAATLLEIANLECTAAIFERAKEDARKEAAKPEIVQMNGGTLHN